jgi:CrcB protein
MTIGFLGGLTTYSSFNFETTRLLEEGAPSLAALNATLTIAGGFVAGLLGLMCAKQVLGR